MQYKSALIVLGLVSGCAHAPAAQPDKVVGEMDHSDPSFLADDPAAVTHCTSDADCPTGALCHPSNLRCFSSSPSPHMLEVVDISATGDQPRCQLVRIYFAFDSAVLVDDATRSLEYDARCLKSRGAKKIVLSGYADSRGTEEHNIALSRERGEATKEALRRAGIDLPIEVVAGGDKRPLLKGTTERAFAFNRRVEIRE